MKKWLRIVMVVIFVLSIATVSSSADDMDAGQLYKGVWFFGTGANVEREVLEMAASCSPDPSNKYDAELSSGKASFYFSVPEIAELSMYGLNEQEKTEYLSEMQGKHYEIEYRPGGVIVIGEIDPVTEY